MKDVILFKNNESNKVENAKTTNKTKTTLAKR